MIYRKRVMEIVISTLFVMLFFNLRVSAGSLNKPVVIDITTDNTDGIYMTGSVIDIKVHFNKDVLITGTPYLELAIGNKIKSATYVSGSGGSVLVFRYKVEGEDREQVLDYNGRSALKGAIEDKITGIAAYLNLPQYKNETGYAGTLGKDRRIQIRGDGVNIKSVNGDEAGNTNWTNNNNPEITLVGIKRGEEIRLLNGMSEIRAWELNPYRENKYIFSPSTLVTNGNNTLKVEVKDRLGGVRVIELPYNVDVAPPEVTSITSTTKSITFSGSDIHSGIVGYMISTVNTKPLQEDAGWTNVSKTSSLSNIVINGLVSNTTYYIWMKDEVGNINDEVSKNTLEVPGLVVGTNITFTLSPSSATSGNVVVTLNATGITGYTLQYSTNGTSWSNYTTGVTYTNNGTIYARLTDGSNTGAVVSRAISNIDRTGPSISQVTAADYTITFTAIDGAEVTGYMVNTSYSTPSATGGGWTATSGTLINPTVTGLAANTQYYIWTKDSLNNISSYAIKTLRQQPTTGVTTWQSGSDVGPAFWGYTYNGIWWGAISTSSVAPSSGWVQGSASYTRGISKNSPSLGFNPPELVMTEGTWYYYFVKDDLGQVARHYARYRIYNGQVQSQY